MKLLPLLFLLFLAACRVGKDVPQADYTYFELMAVDSTKHDGYHAQFMYTWYDSDNRVTYVSYLHRNLNLPIGWSTMGLIRK